MNELGTFINTVTYPVAIGCGLAYIVYKIALVIINKLLVVFDNIIETSKQQTATNKELSSTNAVLVLELKGEMGNMGNQIGDISKKLDKIIDTKEVG